jgi:hypothetical protein
LQHGDKFANVSGVAKNRESSKFAAGRKFSGNDTSMIVVMLTVKLCQGRHFCHGRPLCMTGNCAMDDSFSFDAEVNIAKVDNFA